MRRLAATFAVTTIAVVLVAPPVGASTKADKATVRKVVLRANDVPDGWDASASDQDEDTTGDDKLAECLDRPIGMTRRGRTAKYAGPDFSQGSESFGSEAMAFTSTSAARKSFATFKNDDLASCTAQVFRELFEAQFAASGQTVTIDALDVSSQRFPNVADDAFQVDAKIVVTSNGSTETLYLSTVAMRDGRFGASLTSTAESEPFPATLQARMVRKLGKKLAANT